MAWALSDIRTYLKDLDAEDGSARAQRLYDRIANDANRALHGAGDWSFDRSIQRLFYDAAKSDGTVTVSQDGTAVTGASTAFSTSGAVTDVGKFFRFDGQAHQYRCSAVGGATSATLGDTYRGAALSGDTYQLTHDRLQLNARFRKLAVPDGDDDTYMVWPVTLDELLYERLHGREISFPMICAEEWWTSSTTGGAPDPFLWVYPSPLNRTVLDVPMYFWPVELSSSTDGISAPAEADSAYREFLHAYLFQIQGHQDKYASQLAIAQDRARKDLAQFRASNEGSQKRMWSSDADAPDNVGRVRRMRPASGEPVHE